MPSQQYSLKYVFAKLKSKTHPASFFLDESLIRRAHLLPRLKLPTCYRTIFLRYFRFGNRVCALRHARLGIVMWGPIDSSFRIYSQTMYFIWVWWWTPHPALQTFLPAILYCSFPFEIHKRAGQPLDISSRSAKFPRTAAIDLHVLSAEFPWLYRTKVYKSKRKVKCKNKLLFSKTKFAMSDTTLYALCYDTERMMEIVAARSILLFFVSPGYIGFNMLSWNNFAGRLLPRWWWRCEFPPILSILYWNSVI